MITAAVVQGSKVSFGGSFRKHFEVSSHGIASRHSEIQSRSRRYGCHVKMERMK
jgi:hypothetical protein